MIDRDLPIIKCHYYLHDKIIIHYDIGKPISVFNDFIMGGKIIWN